MKRSRKQPLGQIESDAKKSESPANGVEALANTPSPQPVAPAQVLDAMPKATCEVCRGLGGCILGYKASWRYLTTRPDPFTGYGHTKMDQLTKPRPENGNKPPVKAYGDDGARFIVGASMCAYVQCFQ